MLREAWIVSKTIASLPVVTSPVTPETTVVTVCLSARCKSSTVETVTPNAVPSIPVKNMRGCLDINYIQINIPLHFLNSENENYIYQFYYR